MKLKHLLKGIRDAVILLLLFGSVTVCCGTAKKEHKQINNYNKFPRL